jgi:PAS domain S-box-containing protein
VGQLKAYVDRARAAIGSALTYVGRQERARRSRIGFETLIAETIPQMVWTAGPDGAFDYLNSHWESYTGRGDDELLGEGWLSVVHPHDAVAARDTWRTAVASGESFEFELRCLRWDGVHEWFLARAQPARTAGGRVIRWFGTCTNIHSQKRSEESHRFLAQASTMLFSSLDYKTTLAQVADLAVRHSADWCVIDLLSEDKPDPEAVAISHRDPAMIPHGYELRRRFPIRMNSSVGAGAVIRTGVPELYEEISDERLGTLARDEEHRALLAHLGMRSMMIVPLRVANKILGSITFIISDFRFRYDRVDLEIAEELARRAAIAIDNAKLYGEVESERLRLHSIFMKAPSLITKHRGPQHIFELLNVPAQSWLGREDFVGKPVSALDEELKGTSLEKIFNRVYATGEPFSGCEFQVCREHNGGIDERYFDAVFVPTGRPGGRPDGIIAYAVDVTERVLAKRRVQVLLTELREAVRVRDEFLATLSHELRTPMNVIMGWSSLLQGADDMRLIRHGLEALERNAKAQNELINDLLDVSHIITGKFSINSARVDLTTVIQTALESVKFAADAKEIAIFVRVEEAAAKVFGDASRLRQVLWNLLTNAIKFTPKGGRITVELRRAGEDRTELRVRDSGQGIAPENLPYVFDRFWQGDSTSTRKFGGLGLGLSIVKHLAELHGGSVEVNSEGLGRGATFSILLPRLAPGTAHGAQKQITFVESSPLKAVPAAEALPTPATAPSPRVASLTAASETAGAEKLLQDVRILVVDDSIDSLRLISVILQGSGAIVTTADSVREAIRAFEAAPPDLLVSDIGMPFEDGYALIRKVRAFEERTGFRTPAVALTAYVRGEECREVLAAGFESHIAKPVEPRFLVSSLTKILKENRREANA